MLATSLCLLHEINIALEFTINFYTFDQHFFIADEFFSFLAEWVPCIKSQLNAVLGILAPNMYFSLLSVEFYLYCSYAYPMWFVN